MVNTLGLSRGDIIRAIDAETGAHFEEVRTYKPICPRPGNYVAVVKGRMLLVDLFAPDGFDEADIDMAFGLGTAQRAVDRLRAEKGGGDREEAEQL